MASVLARAWFAMAIYGLGIDGIDRQARLKQGSNQEAM
jgi:hypothetical protein